MANFAALAAARHAVLQKLGWNVEAEGLCGAPAIKVVVGAEAHPTLFKSLGLLGLGRNRVVTVPVDAQGRMRADSLSPFTAPTIICVQQATRGRQATLTRGPLIHFPKPASAHMPPVDGCTWTAPLGFGQ